jgi:hypothetical protein
LDQACQPHRISGGGKIVERTATRKPLLLFLFLGLFLFRAAQRAFL